MMQRAWLRHSRTVLPTRGGGIMHVAMYLRVSGASSAWRGMSFLRPARMARRSSRRRAVSSAISRKAAVRSGSLGSGGVVVHVCGTTKRS